jgi:hypothetical protein
MIESSGGGGQNGPSGNILRMVHNPRMGGAVPAWVKAETAQSQVLSNLARAEAADPSFKTALSYQMQEPVKTKDDEFGFYDLLDMVNPLQHIPIISHLYRKLTGDEIKSAPMIIGGAIFGGPAGAAGGIANVIVREETGTDIAGNALGFLTGDKPEVKKQIPDHPEKRLAAALAGTTPDELPVSLLAFTDRGLAKAPQPEKRITEYFSPYEIY